MTGFDALMDAAHYTRLSKQEWEVAEKEEFTVRRNGRWGGGRGAPRGCSCSGVVG